MDNNKNNSNKKFFNKNNDNKEKKNKINYHILLVPDVESEDVRRISISMQQIEAALVAVVFLLVASLVYGFIMTGQLAKAEGTVSELNSKLALVEQTNSKLSDENADLSEKVSILSDTVNEKVQKENEREEEIARSFIPTGFPMKGTASYNEEETELDGNPVAVFHAGEGTAINAAANGTVASVAGDTSNGYIVMVDHGNGYVSVYRNGSKLLVSEGEEVTADTKLFVIERNHEDLGYQIIKDGEYIDPLELMEING